jgi:hypothetical protein
MYIKWQKQIKLLLTTDGSLILGWVVFLNEMPPIFFLKLIFRLLQFICKNCINIRLVFFKRISGFFEKQAGFFYKIWYNRKVN